MATGLVGGNTICGVFLVRVGIDLGEHRPPQPGRIKQIERVLGDLHLGQTTIGDQKWFLDPCRRTGLRDFRDTACAKTNGRRVGPVCSQTHGLNPS